MIFFFQKKNLHLIKKTKGFHMRYNFFFCTMDGFFRILEKTSSELICTRLQLPSCGPGQAELLGTEIGVDFLMGHLRIFWGKGPYFF